MVEQIIINPSLAEQLETIRIEGHHNMFDFNGVQRRAHERSFYQMVTWMEDNQGEWGSLVVNGFLVDLQDGQLMGHREYFEMYPIETIIEDDAE